MPLSQADAFTLNAVGTCCKLRPQYQIDQWTRIQICGIYPFISSFPKLQGIGAVTLLNCAFSLARDFKSIRSV